MRGGGPPLTVGPKGRAQRGRRPACKYLAFPANEAVQGEM